LLTACNQTSNRWPVVQYEARLVSDTLSALKEHGVVRFVHPAHGERTTKYRQVLDEVLRLEPEERAVVCVLLLRGPQTVGELRTRTERLHGFGDTAEVLAAIDRLAARDEPLVVALPRLPGQKEGRYAHLLGGPVDAEALAAPAASAASGAQEVPAGRRSNIEERLAALEAKVDRLYAILGEDPDPAE
jgi:hypothetical protein